MKPASRRWLSQTGWKLAAAAAAGGAGEFVRRRRTAKNPPAANPPPAPPPQMTTQSSPGQIADLQQAYGAEMAPEAVPHSDGSSADG
jgi:hypothetical protein